MGLEKIINRDNGLVSEGGSLAVQPLSFETNELDICLSGLETLMFYMDSVVKISSLEKEEDKKIALSCLFASEENSVLYSDNIEASLESVWDNLVSGFKLTFKNLGSLLANITDRVDATEAFGKNLITELKKRTGEPSSKTIKLHNLMYREFHAARNGIYINAKEAVVELVAASKNPFDGGSKDFLDKVKKLRTDKSKNITKDILAAAFWPIGIIRLITAGQSEIDVQSLSDIEKTVLEDIKGLKDLKSHIKSVKEITKTSIDEKLITGYVEKNGVSINEARKEYAKYLKLVVSGSKDILNQSIWAANTSLMVGQKQMGLYEVKK